MGRYDALTADVLEWLSSDDRVAARWKALAARLGIDAALVGTIDAAASHRLRKSDRQKLKDMLEAWPHVTPATFNRTSLMDALAREGLHDMHFWLQLVNTDNKRRKEEIASMLSARPRTTHSLTVSPSGASTNYSLPASPYSWYFNGDATSAANPARSAASTPGILKKANYEHFAFCPVTSAARSNNSSANSDYYDLAKSTTSDSRESTPDSTNAANTSFSTVLTINVNGGGADSKSSSAMVTPKSAKSIRFADVEYHNDDDVSYRLRRSSRDEFTVVDDGKGHVSEPNGHFPAIEHSPGQAIRSPVIAQVHLPVNGQVNGHSPVGGQARVGQALGLSPVNGHASAKSLSLGLNKSVHGGQDRSSHSPINGHASALAHVQVHALDHRVDVQDRRSVEKYFDNLITLIEDAAEGL